MSEITPHAPSRREFLHNTGRIAAATALASMVVPKVHAAEDNTIRIALVGCGGRGSGAAADAMSAGNGPIKLVAMADVFPKRLDDSFKNLKQQHSERMDVTEDRKFVGFNGYKQAMDCLRPGDIAIFATPPAFRWVHFTYAVEKGLNVFMEKPISVDGPSSRKMFALGEQAQKKNLKVGVGLMCRHCRARGELFDRIKNGEIGDITMLRAYRMHGPLGTAFSDPRPADQNELMWQIARFHSFLWASGGCYSDFLIHNIDECCWMKDAWPVKAQALGGRHYRGNSVDQNFDAYAVEYTFDDGAKLWLDGRVMAGCYDRFSSFAHGTKGSATISESSHTPSRCKIFKGQNIKDRGGDVAWAFGAREPNPYRLEWEDLIDAVRGDKAYNEVQRGAAASLTTAMGRMAAHTGQEVTWEGILNCEHEFAPDVDKLVMNGPAPIQAGSDGKYSVPQPGITTKREYA